MDLQFDGLVGHGETIANVERMFRRAAVPHAMMFCGPAGVGKRLAANLFAANLLALPYGDQRAGKLSAAESFALCRAGNHPDFHFLSLEEGKKDIPVDAVRELCNTLHLKPYYSRCSVSVIDNAELMSLAASNALLMTLEEPPSHTYLILISSAPQKLPETIVSRCQIVNFAALQAHELAAVLAGILKHTTCAGAVSKELLAVCDESLAGLQLDAFFDAKTSAVVDADKLTEHLTQLGAESAAAQERFNRLFAAKSSAAYALALAAEFAAKDLNSALLWHTLRANLRARLRSTSGADAARYAAILEDALQTERLVKERNLSAQLQLGELLLRAASARPAA